MSATRIQLAVMRDRWEPTAHMIGQLANELHTDGAA